MTAYYNENDPGAAAWLRELIGGGHIAPGEVDTRSIADVAADDLRGFIQCHFFAGIGGWSLALRMAEWPDDRPVWTGSCPCQPFSAASRKRRGVADHRHLWPVWFPLIGECAPPVVFGEQVAGRDGLAWLDIVCADMEDAGYAIGAADLCAAGIGAPHIRQRLFFGAIRTDHAAGGMGDGRGTGSQGRIGMSVGADQFASWPAGLVGGMADGDGGLARHGALQRGRHHRREPQDGEAGGMVEDIEPHGTSAAAGFWRDADWLLCRDGRWRPVEPGAFPLAHGIPGRVGLLRGYGNAIVPQVAATFVRAFSAAATGTINKVGQHDGWRE